MAAGDYYVRVTGDFGDSIEGWAESVGITLDDALGEGVWSPDEGDDQCVYVPRDVLRLLRQLKEEKRINERKN